MSNRITKYLYFYTSNRVTKYLYSYMSNNITKYLYFYMSNIYKQNYLHSLCIVLLITWTYSYCYLKSQDLHTNKREMKIC